MTVLTSLKGISSDQLILFIFYYNFSELVFYIFAKKDLNSFLEMEKLLLQLIQGVEIFKFLKDM